jgi:hypothetical protein
MSKWSLISESVAVIQIDIHPIGEGLDQHVVHMAPWVSRTTTIHEVPTKLKLGPCSRDKSWPSAVVRPDHHSGLPHSPSNKLPRNREVWFNKVVTGLLGLSGIMKLNMRSVQVKVCHRGQNDAVLN